MKTPPQDTPPQDSRIRDATLDDAAAIAAIYGESVAAGDATMDRVPWTADQVVERLRRQGDRFPTLVIEAGGRVLGWAGVRQHNDRLGYRTCCELAVYFRRNETGQGHGRRLVEALLARCEEIGFHHIVARIFAENRGSIRFHERLGFEMVGVQHEIGCVNGRWVDVAVLQKVFDGPAPEDPPPGR